MAEKGLIYIFSGEGKGKTSGALGVSLRMLLIDKKVVWISWFKNKKWPISEVRLERIFPKSLRMYWTGSGFYIKGKRKARANTVWVHDTENENNHIEAAKAGLEIANKVLDEGVTDLLVLDESIQAIKDGLIDESEILELIKKRGSTNIILTGRGVTAKLIKRADLVTEMKKIKHFYDSGGLAVKGLDY